MVIRQAKHAYNHKYKDNERIESQKFAWFPEQMMETENDTSGEVIWLEGYIETNRYREMFKDFVPVKKERIAKKVLREFEK